MISSVLERPQRKDARALRIFSISWELFLLEDHHGLGRKGINDTIYQGKYTSSLFLAFHWLAVWESKNWEEGLNTGDGVLNSYVLPSAEVGNRLLWNQGRKRSAHREGCLSSLLESAPLLASPTSLWVMSPAVLLWLHDSMKQGQSPDPIVIVMCWCTTTIPKLNGREQQPFSCAHNGLSPLHDGRWEDKWLVATQMTGAGIIGRLYAHMICTWAGDLAWLSGHICLSLSPKLGFVTEWQPPDGWTSCTTGQDSTNEYSRKRAGNCVAVYNSASEVTWPQFYHSPLVKAITSCSEPRDGDTVSMEGVWNNLQSQLETAIPSHANESVSRKSGLGTEMPLAHFCGVWRASWESRSAERKKQLLLGF